jgi:hypothetical protein
LTNRAHHWQEGRDAAMRSTGSLGEAQDNANLELEIISGGQTNKIRHIEGATARKYGRFRPPPPFNGSQSITGDFFATVEIRPSPYQTHFSGGLHFEISKLRNSELGLKQPQILMGGPGRRRDLVPMVVAEKKAMHTQPAARYGTLRSRSHSSAKYFQGVLSQRNHLHRFPIGE